MRKILCYLLIIMFLFFGMEKINAATITASPTTVNVGGKFSIELSNPKTNSDYTINYDSTIISAISNTCGSSSTVYENKMPCKIEFKVNESLKLEEDKKIEITLVDKASSDATSPVTITIKKNVNKPSTTSSTTTSTTSSSTTTTTTVSAKSDDATLKSVEVIDSDQKKITLSPEFKSDVTTYSATVPGTTKRIAINAVLNDSKATMKLSENINKELTEGANNQMTITVIAESGKVNTYTFNISREALNTDATLKSLNIKEYPNFTFNEKIFSYTVKYDPKITKLTIDYVANEESSKVSIEGNSNLKSGSIVKIIVEAEDGTKRQYEIKLEDINKTTTTTKSTVEKPTVNERNPLIIMGLSIIAFSLIGGIVYVIKK